MLDKTWQKRSHSLWNVMLSIPILDWRTFPFFTRLKILKRSKYFLMTTFSGCLEFAFRSKVTSIFYSWMKIWILTYTSYFLKWINWWTSVFIFSSNRYTGVWCRVKRFCQPTTPILTYGNVTEACLFKMAPISRRQRADERRKPTLTLRPLLVLLISLRGIFKLHFVL